MEEPENLIPEEKMVDVLADLAILHAARSYNKDMLENKGIKPEAYLYEKHSIDSAQFHESSRYYAENYEIYERIYDSVRAKLERFKEKYQTLKFEQEALDSVRELSRPERGIRNSRDSEMPGNSSDTLN